MGRNLNGRLVNSLNSRSENERKNLSSMTKNNNLSYKNKNHVPPCPYAGKLQL